MYLKQQLLLFASDNYIDQTGVFFVGEMFLYFFFPNLFQSQCKALVT